MPSKSESVDTDDLDKWLTPAQALSELDHLKGNHEAARAVLQWLRHGRLRAVAKSAVVGTDDREDILITKAVWAAVGDHFEHDAFWRSSCFELDIYQGHSRPHLHTAFFNVRFDPAGIQSMLPPVRQANPPPPSTSAAPPPSDKEQLDPGPRVSDPHLKAWYEVFKQAYPGNEATNDKALESAKGMFPGKFVDRKRVRKLRGSQKPGRKPTAD